jgi:hypothetical protein
MTMDFILPIKIRKSVSDVKGTCAAFAGAMILSNLISVLWKQMIWGGTLKDHVADLVRMV